MKVDFKQQKYIIPLLVLPFIFFGFYLYNDTFGDEPAVAVGGDGLQENITEASDDVRKSDLTDKLQAFQDTYKGGDGYTAITGIGREEEELARYDDLYTLQEKARLDSLEEEYRRTLHNTYGGSQGGYEPRAGRMAEQDRALLEIISQSNRQPVQQTVENQQHDPMELMKAQYALMDSLQKANDPEHQAEMRRLAQEEAHERERERRRLNRLTVQRADMTKSVFNTLKPERDNGFIRAIIDEGITGYAGSRIRIRLLEDILVGDHPIKKGTYLYAVVSGFSEQRVTLAVNSAVAGQRKLPINLIVYDLDGLEGLYVPESSFREFTKDLGTSSMQGMNMSQNPESQNEFLMSGLQRMFTSTSQAIANAIRMNKANLKYSTHIYLIDGEELSH